MRARTKTEMDEVMRSLVRDCFTMMDQAELTQTDMANLLGTSRINVNKWARHLRDDGDWTTLPVSGNSAAVLFMNLLIVRHALETALASGELPAVNTHRRGRWVSSVIDPAR